MGASGRTTALRGKVRVTVESPHSDPPLRSPIPSLDFLQVSPFELIRQATGAVRRLDSAKAHEPNFIRVNNSGFLISRALNITLTTLQKITASMYMITNHKM